MPELLSILLTIIKARFEPGHPSLGMEIGKRREKLHMTRRELAEAIGRKPATIMKYEAGTKHIPYGTLCKIADALHTNTEQLLHPGHIMMTKDYIMCGPEDCAETAFSEYPPFIKTKIKESVESGKPLYFSIDSPGYAKAMKKQTQQKNTDTQ